MPVSIKDAKERLDLLIQKARVDLYKPIQIAEVLRHSRIEGDIKVSNLETYRNPSIHWRDEVTKRLLGKISTSSARYQHDVWNPTAMPPDILVVLDNENRKTKGSVERYIYTRFSERQGTVSEIISAIVSATPEKFQLDGLLKLFIMNPGIRRSIDKAYEIVAHSLFETVVTALNATVTIKVPNEKKELLKEFSDLTKVLLGLDDKHHEWEQQAHLYRVGVTNAADRGLDMWANFGPAVQVKHLTLNEKIANVIIDQVESDHIVIVCRDADAEVIGTISKQIGWGRRVRGIVKESDLKEWYEKCLRGKYSNLLAKILLQNLSNGFQLEFPQNASVAGFMKERGYQKTPFNQLWMTDVESTIRSR